jgi:G3E family GTPase
MLCLNEKVSYPLDPAYMTEKYNPARIIVETSGSAFPAPIAIRIRQLTRENRGVYLDSIITVVDWVNFRGYDLAIPALVLTKGYIIHSKTLGTVY